MKKNLSSADRIIRLIAGVVCIMLFITQIVVGGFGIVLVVIGGILMITSFKSFCPIYLPFGISTCKEQTNRSQKQH